MDIEFLAPFTPRGLPAPVPFLQFFKLVGFVLHMVPMHILLAGTPLVALLLLRRHPHGRTLARRLAGLLPIIVALAVNFGIVPLLFIQVTHYRAFYPATIFMAWPWFSVVFLLIVAYYAIYYAATKCRTGEPSRLVGFWTAISALLVVAISFIFANAMSLLTNVDGWAAIYERTQVAGAVTGLGLNTGDRTMLPRWIMMFGLAMTTLGVWIALDTAVWAKPETAEYRAWARKTAWEVHAVGMVVFGSAGYVYLFRTLDPEHLAVMTGQPLVWLTAFTAVMPAVVLALMWRIRQRADGGGTGLAAALQLVTLVLNAASRQWLQTYELMPYMRLEDEKVHTQWSTLPVFLVVFVLTLAFVAWLLIRAVKEAGTPIADQAS